MQNEVIEFLKESNNIEDEWDDTSLAQAIYAWNYLIQEDRLSVGAVLKTHKILMLKHNLMPNEKGYFRTVPVWIGGREGKPHFAVPELVKNWVDDVNVLLEKPYKPGLDELAKISHIQYENIHPFVDGNGRTGRIFLNWLRVKTQLPVLIIREAEKFEYYSWFK